MNTPTTHFIEPSRHTARVLLGILTLVLLLCGAAIWLVFTDTAPPDDARMLADLPGAASLNNPLARYRAEVLSFLPPEAVPTVPSIPNDAVAPSVDKELLALYETLLASDATTWRWPREDITEDLTPSYHLQLNLSVTSHLQRAQRLAIDSHDEEAANQTLQVLRLGHGLTRARGDSRIFRLGLDIQSRAWQHLARLMKDRLVPAEELRRRLSLLTELPPPTPSDYADCRRAEYLALKETIRGRLETVVDQHTLMDSAFTDLTGMERTLKLNQTLALRCRSEENTISSLKHGWLPTYYRDAEVVDPIRRITGTWWHRHSGNYIGRHIHLHLSEVNYALLRSILSAHALYDVTRVILALRIYELGNQRLPSQLADLAPGILPTVPLDIFSGTPLNWDRNTHTIYSIGPDLQSNNGNVTTYHDGEYPGTPDIGMKYWWGAPTPAKSEEPPPPRNSILPFPQ